MKSDIPQYCSAIEDIFPPVEGIKEGEVGIEIEVEGEKLLDRVPSYWEVHKEPSLRGESKEYVLRKPLKRKSVYPVLKYLKKKLDDHGSVCHDSQRTGVHVHINCQKLPLRQIYNFICLYLLFEDILVEYAGETRVGNVFCLRAKDAEYFVDELVNAVQKDNYRVFHNEQSMRYASVNVCALWKFNSLEFRALRGTTDPDVIDEWVRLLLALKDASQAYHDPRDIIQDFSVLGPRRFIERVFPYPLYAGLNLRGVDEVLWHSVRLVQEIAYAVNWRYLEKTPARRRFASNNYPKPRIQHDGGEDAQEPLPAAAIRARRPMNAAELVNRPWIRIDQEND